jgi:hypothetical protein
MDCTQRSERAARARLAALVANSDVLRNLHALSRVPGPQAPPLPLRSPVAGRVDERFAGGVLTRARKSTVSPVAPDRMRSEWYPLAPPRVDFITGANSRLLGRDPAVYSA